MADKKFRPPRAITFTLDCPTTIEEVATLCGQRKPYVTNGGEYLIMSMSQQYGWDRMVTAEVSMTLIRSIDNG